MIQNENVFYNNTYLESSTGHIMIGSRNQFGIGQVIVKSNHKDAEIIIGDEGRYVGNISIFGKTTLGSGSQILGDITLNQCELESGESYLCGNPNKRGAVIKGFGTAKNIKVVSGFVVKGDGIFESSNMEPQINYHVEDNL